MLTGPTGASPSADEAEYKCPKCRDLGWLREEVPYGELGWPARYHRCDCMREVDRQGFVRVARLPIGADLLTFAAFKPRPGLEEAVAAARQLASGDGTLKWLTLCGGVDSGKSHLACAIAHAWLDQGRSCRYALAPALLDELRAGFDPKAEITFQDQFEALCRVPLLILDDLRMTRTTDWALEKFEMLLERRYEDKLYQVVTTDKPMAEVARWSERIASRLMRFVPRKVVIIQAPEYRVWEKER